ncbi:hypothetical protein Gotri_006659 [Gossypium trilobum]|uniref:Uncharacterized protein n=1 Tax=Gossypium trilobum TaxID=34281 RepID=A0A7J9F1M1_9ROSI|nr:hypothetical protein [Gossypium trilobum]
MEGVGARLGRSSTRYGPVTVFTGPVRKWKKKWVNVSPPNTGGGGGNNNNHSQNHHSNSNGTSNGNNGPHLVLFKWTPITQSQNNNNYTNNSPKEDTVAAPEEPPRRKFKYIPVTFLFLPWDLILVFIDINYWICELGFGFIVVLGFSFVVRFNGTALKGPVKFSGHKTYNCFDCLIVQIAVLEEQKREAAENEAAENVDDEAKPSESDPSVAEPTSRTDGFDEKPDINDVPMEENEEDDKMVRQDLNESTLDLSLGLTAHDGESDSKPNRHGQLERVKSSSR